ncbi:MAG: 3'-5' exonuclease [Candidatus Berkiella sp.]
MSIFVFDIETVPDVESGRRLLGLESEPDEVVLSAMESQTKEATGGTFVKHHLQKIVAISALLRVDDKVKVWSLGNVDAAEAELIQRFYAGIEKHKPTLVSWNGSGFDLPVLHYRALLHGVSAGSYWDMGEDDSSFKYNNYLNRYHTRHLDLMDILAAYQAKAYARLDDIAKMLGFPGKMGIDGSEVLNYFMSGDRKTIRDYCETDVLNTYLVFLRFQLMRGHLSPAQYDNEIILTKTMLHDSEEAHLQAFLDAWLEKE